MKTITDGDGGREFAVSILQKWFERETSLLGKTLKTGVCGLFLLFFLWLLKYGFYKH